MKFFAAMVLALCSVVGAVAGPLEELVERVAPGRSADFVFEKHIESDSAMGVKPWFELRSTADGRIAVRGNDYTSMAYGFHHYLKNYCNRQLSWENMVVELPDTLPAIAEPVRRESRADWRYYLNYCTFSYSMAFWDWERWGREIDWMALHGINLPLALTGTEAVWRAVLERLGYPADRVGAFIAGPAFQAWWLMNNLEEWGGPNTDHWYTRQEELQKRILIRMKELDMKPVLPGYSGMLPHDAAETLGVDVADPGLWCSYRRPAFLQPSHKDFGRIADAYYAELERLYGKADFYSMDPFHEGGNTRGVDLDGAGKEILAAMKRANLEAVWVVQAWGENPRADMIAGLPEGDMLDLSSECVPQWGVPGSWRRPEGFGHHLWSFCMLLNYGGNPGLYGKLPYLFEAYGSAVESPAGERMRGIGLTMEGIENNSVMYELMTDLPWMGADAPEPKEWLADYLKARYGASDPRVEEAWALLADGVYNCPPASTQQGARESVFCARPSAGVEDVSAWAKSEPYYDPASVRRAAGLMLAAAERFEGSAAFEHDLVDIARQAVAEEGRSVLASVREAIASRDTAAFSAAGNRFLRLIAAQDNLVGSIPRWRLGHQIAMAEECAAEEYERDLYRWNLLKLVTTWGNREASERGKLHDYAHREWQGLLGEYYLPRWRHWFAEAGAALRRSAAAGTPFEEPEIDWYDFEEPFSLTDRRFDPVPSARPVDAARRALESLSR